MILALYSTGNCDSVTIIALDSTNKCDWVTSSNSQVVHLPQKSPTVKTKYFLQSKNLREKITQLKDFVLKLALL